LSLLATVGASGALSHDDVLASGRDRYCERRALSWRAFHAESRADQIRQFLDKIKPQADPFVFPSIRAIELTKQFKDLGQGLLKNADTSIRDGKLYGFPFDEEAGREGHRAAIGKFNGIVNQILQDRCQLRTVRVDCR